MKDLEKDKSYYLGNLNEQQAGELFDWLKENGTCWMDKQRFMTNAIYSDDYLEYFTEYREFLWSDIPTWGKTDAVTLFKVFEIGDYVKVDEDYLDIYGINHPKLVRIIEPNERHPPSVGYLTVNINHNSGGGLNVPMNKLTKINMKTLTVTGSKPLLKALFEELGVKNEVTSEVYMFENQIFTPIDKPSDSTLTLPRDYEKALDLFKVEKFKVGDWVMVLPEDRFYDNSEKIPQQITSIDNDGWVTLSFSDRMKVNSYTKIRHATDEDFKLPKINGYKGSITDEFIKYGCALLPIAWFMNYGGQTRTMETIKLSSGVEISGTEIKKIKVYVSKYKK